MEEPVTSPAEAEEAFEAEVSDLNAEVQRTEFSGLDDLPLGDVSNEVPLTAAEEAQLQADQERARENRQIDADEAARLRDEYDPTTGDLTLDRPAQRRRRTVVQRILQGR
tara:strand:+ start:153 stop:482 length:330 start_codon:yes stop_codon:yes gene_type:complete